MTLTAPVLLYISDEERGVWVLTLAPIPVGVTSAYGSGDFIEGTLEFVAFLFAVSITARKNDSKHNSANPSEKYDSEPDNSKPVVNSPFIRCHLSPLAFTIQRPFDPENNPPITVPEIVNEIIFPGVTCRSSIPLYLIVHPLATRPAFVTLMVAHEIVVGGFDNCE